MDDWTTSPVDDATLALFRFADKLTTDPSTMTRDDLQSLRDAGWSDEAVHDAVQVISYFNYINRVADALGVEVETMDRRWGRANSDEAHSRP